MLSQNLANLIRQSLHFLIIRLSWNRRIFMLALAGNLISLTLDVSRIARFDFQLLDNGGVRPALWGRSTRAYQFLLAHLRSARKIGDGLFPAEFLTKHGLRLFDRNRPGPNPGLLQTVALGLKQIAFARKRGPP